MCDAQIGARRSERRHIGRAINHPLAGRADAGEKPGRRGFGDVIHYITGWPFWRSTANAIDFARAARLLARLLRFEEGAQIAPKNKERPLVFDEGEAALNPSANGVLMHAQELRSF
jgi:hypothetical protein